MLSRTEARRLIDGIFEQEALIIGGLVTLREIDDDAVWRLIRSLDVIRERTLRALEEKEADLTDEPPDDVPNLEPHPAVEEFLLKLRRTEREIRT
jgi:hypothetical protein